MKPAASYQPKKGDCVDEMFASHLNRFGIQLPITRLGNGFYMIGTKKIYAEIRNNKLLVRVGGGYMGIDEFISTYGEQEIQKLKRYTPQTIADMHLPPEQQTGYKGNAPIRFVK